MLKNIKKMIKNDRFWAIIFAYLRVWSILLRAAKKNQKYEIRISKFETNSNDQNSKQKIRCEKAPAFAKATVDKLRHEENWVS